VDIGDLRNGRLPFGSVSFDFHPGYALESAELHSIATKRRVAGGPDHLPVWVVIS